MGSKLGAAIVIFAYAIVLFLMVRPGSQGPSLVTAIADGTSNVIKSGTGGGTWANG